MSDPKSRKYVPGHARFEDRLCSFTWWDIWTWGPGTGRSSHHMEAHLSHENKRLYAFVCVSFQRGFLAALQSRCEGALSSFDVLSSLKRRRWGSSAQLVRAGGMEKSRRSRNIWNAALAVVVAIPALIFHYAFLYHCPGETQHEGSSTLALWSGVCEWGREHPLGLVNVIFFLNVDVLFWIISLVQGSTWLIDPYWTIIPVMIGYFYGTHPNASSDIWRSRAVMSLLWAWSIRLTNSYFRRENWQWGEREDWRFSQLRTQHPRHWWWMSFFAAYVSQQVFLVGICLPLYAVYSNQTPWSTWDTVAALLCGAGIVIAYFADTQLHVFMSTNQRLRDLGAPPVPVLQEGVWKYSRHPNYVGEQLWWWGLALFAWNLQQGWMVAGAAVNTACLAYVTVLVERKMLEKPSRAAAYRRYQATTSVWIPWIIFPSGAAGKKIQ